MEGLRLGWFVVVLCLAAMLDDLGTEKLDTEMVVLSAVLKAYVQVVVLVDELVFWVKYTLVINPYMPRYV